MYHTPLESYDRAESIGIGGVVVSVIVFKPRPQMCSSAPSRHRKMGVIFLETSRQPDYKNISLILLRLKGAELLTKRRGLKTTKAIVTPPISMDSTLSHDSNGI